MERNNHINKSDMEITEKIKTYEDALKETGRPDVPDMSAFPEDMRKHFTALYKLDYEAGVRTQHGENRYVVKIKADGKECKFFTNSTPIKEALEKISHEDFPFITVIRAKKLGMGNSKMYYFT